MKTIGRVLLTIIVSLFRAVWLIIKWTVKLIWLLVKLLFWPFGLNSSSSQPDESSQPPRPLNVLFDDPPALSGTEREPPPVPPALVATEPLAKIGSILPVEEDHDLRTFTVLNNEGEIYKINTALPGPFYGPVWTRILSCYENRQTLRGRLVKEVYGQSGYRAGYRVKIGNINTFLPNYHSLRRDMQQGINLRVAVLHINQATARVMVSARIAYEIILGHKPAPAQGEESEALFWDYDEQFLYLLLPGHCVGKTAYCQQETTVAAWMGNITRCRIDAIDVAEQEAKVSIIEATDPGAALDDDQPFFESDHQALVAANAVLSAPED